LGKNKHNTSFQGNKTASQMQVVKKQQTQNNHLLTYLHFFIEFSSLYFCNFIGFCNAFNILINKSKIIKIFFIQRLWFQVVNFVSNIVIQNINISIPFHGLPFLFL
jgi:hypothetical protein